MTRRIAFAAFLGISLAGAGAVAACPLAHPKNKAHPAKIRSAMDPCIDFNRVPQISEHIVAVEPAGPHAKAPTPAPAGTPAYNGPTIGFARPGVKSAPTIGYRWSLE
ncbi:MAG TPA: hypothetical protein VET89_01050 [Stellaceae bacterium]|nr:hypothetical protein [Stellaceae bacterium]